MTQYSTAQIEQQMQQLKSMTNQNTSNQIVLRFKAEVSKRMRILRQAFEDFCGNKRFDDEVSTKLRNIFLEIDDWLDFLELMSENNRGEKELNDAKPEYRPNVNDAQVKQFSDTINVRNDDQHNCGGNSRQTIQRSNYDPLSVVAAIGDSIKESKEGILTDFELVQINDLVPDECGSSELKTECSETIFIKSELVFDEIYHNSIENDESSESDLLVDQSKRKSNQIQEQLEHDDFSNMLFNSDESFGDTKSHEISLNCYICKETSASMDDLRKHLKKHRPYKFVSCKICGKTVTQPSNLKIHHRTHTGEKPFECNICGKTLARISSLKIHLRIHTGERPFKCDVCGKLFTARCQQTRHSRIHSGERPFKCNICGFGFMQSSNLKTHMRIHTGEKPFKCEICGKAFCSSSDLKRHSKIHFHGKSLK